MEKSQVGYKTPKRKQKYTHSPHQKKQKQKNLLPPNQRGEHHARDHVCNRLSERYTGTVTNQTVIRL